MKYFLVKTEPSVYSVDKFKEDHITSWNGVRNPQAVIFLQSMQPKDMVLVYHTDGEKTIVGLGEVVGNSRPDPKDPKSWLVDMKFVKKFSPPFVSLADFKSSGKFQHFRLVTQSRLSVMPVPEDVILFLKTRGIEI